MAEILANGTTSRRYPNYKTRPILRAIMLLTHHDQNSTSEREKMAMTNKTKVQRQIENAE